MTLVSIFGHNLMPQVGNELAVGYDPVDPIGMDFGNRAQHHIQAVVRRMIHDPVVVVIVERAGLRFHPGPHDP